MSSHIPRNILFLAEGQLGDLLLLTPALRATKQTFPHATLSLLVVHRRPLANIPNPPPLIVESRHLGSSEVFAENPNVDHVFNVSRSLLREGKKADRIGREWRLVRFIRSLKSDVVVCTFPEDRFALLAYASGAAVRVGQRRQGFWRLLTLTPDVDKSQGGVLQYYCSLVEAFGARACSTETEYRVPEKSRRWAADVLQAAGFKQDECMISVHPGASGDYKIWPPERYAALANTLNEHGVGRVLFCPGVADVSVIGAIQPLLHPGVRIIESATEVGRLGALLERSSLCITNDSGPRHLAVAQKMPVLALFRQHHDREWGIYPESHRCRTLRGSAECSACPSGKCLDRIPPGERFGCYCMRMIEVSEAVQAAETMLRAVPLS